MKKLMILSTLALGLAAAPAMAQEAPQGTPEAPVAQAEAPAAQAATAKAGDTVYDTAGEVVGTVESVSGDNFVLSTGSNKATLPLSAVATGAKGPTISMSKTQLDAEIAKASAPAS